MKLKTPKTNSIDVQVLKDAAWLLLATPRWGNRRQGTLADNGNGESDAPKPQKSEPKRGRRARRLRLSKRLIESPEYDAICSFQNETREWCLNRCNLSYLFDGLYIAKNDVAEQIETRLREASDKLQNVLIPALLRAYPQRQEEAKKALDEEAKRANLPPQFVESDYPPAKDLAATFGIEWAWVQMQVPTGLPVSIQTTERQKMDEGLQEAAQDILFAVRESFAQLIEHAAERLTNEPGEKPKTFRDSAIDNVRAFIETFNARNIFNDAALADLVEKARLVVDNTSPRKLRKNADARERVAAQFSAVKKSLDGLIGERKARKFDFSETA